MIHLVKLAVGVRDLDHLRAVQAERLASAPPLCHRTRTTPRRATELCAGGSIYWVVAGMLQARQRVVATEPAAWEDGSACCALILDPVLVPVAPRAVRPFQGWRYLAPDDAPADLGAGPGGPGGLGTVLPAALQRELRLLCLI